MAEVAKDRLTAAFAGAGTGILQSTGVNKADRIQNQPRALSDDKTLIANAVVQAQRASGDILSYRLRLRDNIFDGLLILCMIAFLLTGMRDNKLDLLVQFFGSGRQHDQFFTGFHQAFHF